MLHELLLYYFSFKGQTKSSLEKLFKEQFKLTFGSSPKLTIKTELK